jgi:hypothetical protein
MDRTWQTAARRSRTHHPQARAGSDGDRLTKLTTTTTCRSSWFMHPVPQPGDNDWKAPARTRHMRRNGGRLAAVKQSIGRESSVRFRAAHRSPTSIGAGEDDDVRPSRSSRCMNASVSVVDPIREYHRGWGR